MRPISQGIATSYPRISRLGFPTPGMLPVSVPAISTIPCPPSCAADVDPSEESARSYSVMNHADETIIRISRRLPEEAALASPAVAIQ
jgi:hypothetical protein